MAVGRPIKLTPNVARKSVSITATAGQTTFTPTGGYRINDLAVYRNGVRLVNGKDFTAVDGANVILQSSATLDDVLEFGIFDSFNIADAISSVGNQTIDGELTVSKIIGDGSELTGIGTADINTNNIQVSGISTFGSGASTFSGEVTAAGGVDVTGGVKSAGIVTFTNTTASTSSATGALVVSGGVGIAGSLHVGENVSVGGTLTYEDVTNVDVIGIITAKSNSANPLQITGTNDAKILLKGSNSPYITFQEASSNKAYLQWNASGYLSFQNVEDGARLRIKDDIDFSSDNGSSFTSVIHAGNVGDGEALSTKNVYVNQIHGDGSNLTNVSATASISTTASTASGIVSTLTLAKQDHKVTVSGISTFTCSGGTDGQSHTLRIVNSGITTVGFSSYFLFPSGTSPTLPTADGAVSLISFTVHRVGTPGIATQLLAGASLNLS